MHVGRDASADLWSAGSPVDWFTKPVDHSLMLRGIQYQGHFGSGDSPADDVGMNVPSPWDLRRLDLSCAEAKDRYGIVVRRGHTAQRRRVMEWFLPWSAVGTGGEWSQPPVGERLAAVLGYNDFDRRPDGPESRVNLRWPRGVDPWRHPARQGPEPNPYGDIEIGPALTH
jgi:hypothetical protein